MRDEIDARMWVEHGRGLSDLIDRRLRTLGDVSRKMVAVQFEAPWRSRAKHEL